MSLSTQVTVFCPLTGQILAQATHPGASTSYRIARETVTRFHPAVAEIRAARSEEHTTRGLFGGSETRTIHYLGDIIARLHSTPVPES